MPLCDSLRRSAWRRILCLWMAVALWAAAAVHADPPQSDPFSAESLWSKEFPAVETRMYWGWPKFLSERWSMFEPIDPASVSLVPPKAHRWRFLGKIESLIKTKEPEPPLRLVEPIVVRADDGGLESQPFSDGPADYRVTLVRGGAPPLFGARGRLRGEYGNDFDDLTRIRGQLLWSFNGHVGVDVSVNSWQDKRPRPQALGDFWTGDANFVYSLGSQYIAMRGGLGAAWFYDKDFDLGYNLTYGADLFLKRPFLVSAEVDWGKISGDKLLHYRGTFGFQLLRFELYVGYDSYRLGDLHFNGPMAGAGIWF